MRLSIITINFNNQGGLERTLLSLAGQTWRDFESIIIDGGSTDESTNVIRSFENAKSIPITKWVSEKDKGIYNAQNKGAGFATGEYFLFLNSGDYLYHSDTLNELMPSEWSADIVYGNIVVLEGRRKIRTNIPPVITAEFLYTYTLWHPASFIRRSLFTQLGPYREDFKICSDYYFFVKAVLKHRATLQHKKNVVSVFNTDGFGSNPKNREIELKERDETIAEFFPPPMLTLIREHEKQRSRMNSFRFAVLALPRYVFRKLRRLLFKM